MARAKVLIIGGGFAGCAAADYFSSDERFDTVLVEQSSQLGAGVRTYFMGGHPYTFGPRHFLTKNEWIFDYLNEFVPLRRCADHEFLTYVEKDEQFYTYPIHVDDIEKMPDKLTIRDELSKLSASEGDLLPRNLEEYWLLSVGESLYRKFIDSYSKKMWMVEKNSEIDSFSWSPKGVALKSGPRAAWDSAISAFPLARNGYNNYFDKSTSRSLVLLSSRAEPVDIKNKIFAINGARTRFDIVVNTISPDLLFEEKMGALPFIGRDIHNIVLPVEYALPENVYFCYYAGGEKFTRVTEYKKFYQYQSNSTLISVEIPSKNGRHYPVPISRYRDLASAYLSELPGGFYSIGRAGSYRYEVDIDDCIEQARDAYLSAR